jgi:NAD(P)-dependent dehydrogenase (short-subunit alcohol dehydrogenase family)
MPAASAAMCPTLQTSTGSRRVVRLEAGTIEVLFANAGGGSFVPLGDITEEHYERTFATNVKGTLFTVQKALPFLRDGASVILTGSTTGTPAFSVYSANKAEIRSFARCWILDLASRRIRVNVLVPGVTASPDGTVWPSRRNRTGRCKWCRAPPHRWDASALRTRRQVRRCLSRRTRAASSTAASYSWTAVPLRSEYQFICT